MKKIKNLFGLIAALCTACAPTLLMAIGIWMIYNIGLWIGLIIGVVGCAGTLYNGCTALEIIGSRKTK